MIEVWNYGRMAMTVKPELTIGTERRYEDVKLPVDDAVDQVKRLIAPLVQCGIVFILMLG